MNELKIKVFCDKTSNWAVPLQCCTVYIHSVTWLTTGHSIPYNVNVRTKSNSSVSQCCSCTHWYMSVIVALVIVVTALVTELPLVLEYHTSLVMELTCLCCYPVRWTSNLDDQANALEPTSPTMNLPDNLFSISDLRCMWRNQRVTTKMVHLKPTHSLFLLFFILVDLDLNYVQVILN